jgi:hypothetical protein
MSQKINKARIREVGFKPQYIIPCWIFGVVFLVTAFYFRNLSDLFGVLGYFVILYALIIFLYFVVALYIKDQIINYDPGWGRDLHKIYKDLRIGIFFPADTNSKDVGFRVGLNIILFILLPYIIYEKINGSAAIPYVPVNFIIGICVYAQVRTLFEFGFSFYSKGDE